MESDIVCYQSTCTWLVLDWKSTWCTWCLPSTLSTWTCTCTCKYEKVLVLDSSTSKSTWPQPWFLCIKTPHVMILDCRFICVKLFWFETSDETTCNDRPEGPGGESLPVNTWKHRAPKGDANRSVNRIRFEFGGTVYRLRKSVLITALVLTLVQFSTQPTTAFCLWEIFQILKMGRHFWYPCISCCNIWYAKICACPTVLVGIFYVLTHCVLLTSCGITGHVSVNTLQVPSHYLYQC